VAATTEVAGGGRAAGTILLAEGVLAVEAGDAAGVAEA
jgi:hypothetical protein